jgi:hypothetical protein
MMPRVRFPGSAVHLRFGTSSAVVVCVLGDLAESS